MADSVKQLGTELEVGISASDITIDGVYGIRTSVATNEGYTAITETVGEESGAVENVTMSNYKKVVNISGYVKSGATIPKDGDTVTVSGYSIAYISGITYTKTQSEKAVLNATITAMGRTTTTA